MRNVFVAFALVLTIAPLVLAQEYSGNILYSGVGGLTLDLQSSIATQTAGGTIQHATLWSAPDGSATDLNPPGFNQSDATSSDGTQQVGYAYDSAVSDREPQAILWSGTAQSAVNLNPAGFISSGAFGVAGGFQVGYGSTGGNTEHALLWNGTSASAIDLNPPGFDNSGAFGITGSQQVGDGEGSSTGNNYHALLWSGTADSAIDLNPSGFSFSEALGVGGNEQVGDASLDSDGISVQAMVWSGTAASSVDLDPTKLGDISTSTAVGTNGSQQVGFAQLNNGGFEAIVWSGTAASAVNLQQLLPSTGAWSQSWAMYIDGSGNVFGYADGTLDGVSGLFAVEWLPVPEPTSISVLALGVFGLLRRRRERSLYSALAVSVVGVRS